jgi:tetratricopeptide (TPR) repeat protein
MVCSNIKTYIINGAAILSIAAFFFATYITRYETSNSFDPQLEATLIPPEQLQYFTFGNRDVIADFLWLRYLQGIDPCTKNCTLGWSYRILDAVITLSPSFRFAYRIGGDTLAVIVGDKEGAAKIFEKGIKQYPQYTALLQSYAYLLMFELNQPAEAAEVLIKAVDQGAPKWMLSLAARLYSKAGRNELAENVLKEYIEKFPDDAVKRKAAERLKQIQAGGKDTFVKQKSETELSETK